MTAATITANGFTGFLGRGAAPRELQCLMAVAAGKTSKEAARDLGISPDTINKRLLSLTTKLGVTRRGALVAEAFKRGLITPAVVALCAVIVGHNIASADDEFTRVRRSGERKLVETRVSRRAECALAVA
ncbi:helix-turn-helix domain-containing protein [Pseudomonas piscis]|uniref:Helix-turn-helix domain-containing protein n=1 Tax=Pseudomonas piscis TaxID=2614538 RepID=A0ABY9NL05_9PSED|nr:helix-turn-helix domain-containing protein [Pseudomonas piscis]WMN19239.1 helix-turn-helix domain-containing protein [Pseudomonas piscis]